MSHAERVIGQHSHGEADSGTLVFVAGERSGAVRKAKSAVGGYADDVGAITVTVGYECDAGEPAHDREIACVWEIGMRHDDLVVVASQCVDTRRPPHR